MNETWREKFTRLLPPWLKRSLAVAKGVADRAVVVDRIFIASRYIRGKGIEIGALATPVQVPPGARVRYVDRYSREDLIRDFPNVASMPVVPVDIVDDGERLSRVADRSQDFVIANHFLEHCENTLLALSNMFRVLRPDGVLFLALPEMRFTFDRHRTETPVEHVLRDFQDGAEWSRRMHFEEWVRLVLRLEGEETIRAEIDRLMAKNQSIHFHAWTQRGMFELLETCRSRTGERFDIEFFLMRNDECIFILRKKDRS